jgi:hypothetical protein
MLHKVSGTLVDVVRISGVIMYHHLKWRKLHLCSPPTHFFVSSNVADRFGVLTIITAAPVITNAIGKQHIETHCR